MPDPVRPSGQRFKGPTGPARTPGRLDARPASAAGATRPAIASRGSPGTRAGPPRRPRFTPRDPSRARYYRASLIAAGVFVALALAFPFWLDHVRRNRDRESFDSLRSFTPPVTRTTATPARDDRPPGSSLPYSPESGHATCQAYATARCNALRIPPGPCGEVATAALAVPPTAGLAECRKTVEPKLAEAARLHGPPEGSEAEAAGYSTSGPPTEAPTPTTPTTEPPPPTRAEAVPEPGPDSPSASTTQVMAAPASSAPSPADRADNLARIHVLIEELQRGAQNYATAPAAQAARFEELRRRVEADGSEELRTVYNTLLMQHGRTAGVEMPRPGLQAGEAAMTPAASGEERARTTTPEMDRVRGMLEDARRQAGPGAVPPPSTGPTSPPAAVDPSTVQAPPARSL